jgi:hypothetical protein
VSDVTTKIQIWNASNNGNVGHTVCYPVLFQGVTCHTDPWKSVSFILVFIYLILLKYLGIAYHKVCFWFSEANPGGPGDQQFLQ